MTASEAIEILQEEHDYAQLLSYVNEALQMACNALEKQIPKKATEKTTNRGIDISGEYDIDFDLCCPVCGGVVGTFETGENEYFSKYCDNCGQALDWSDT